MLNTLRASVSSWVVKILFLLLVASFAVWGIGDIFRSPGQEATVAKVGDVAITGEQLSREFRREMNRLQSLFRGQLDVEQARQMGLDRRVLNDMISRTLFNVYATEIGMTVPDNLVVQQIRNDPVFRNDLGQFDRSRFNFLLQQNGLTEPEYVALLRRDIARDHLVSAVTAGVSAPPALVEALHSYRAETRVAETLLIPASSITGIPTPDDAALAAFHEGHADRYQAPEYRSVAIVELSPQELAKEIKVSDEDVRAAYEERRGGFNVPERRQIEQIVFPDEAAAKAAADMLREGLAFAEVAQRTTGGAPIDLGTVERATMLQELSDAAFTPAEGQVSAPVQSPLGWHLLHVTEVEPAHAPTFEELEEELRHDIAMNQAVDSIISIANQLEDELAGGASLKEAAEQLNLNMTQIEAVSAAGKAPNGTDTALVGRPALLSLAFSTPEGEDSALTETRGGGYAILRVNSVQPPALRPLEEVREQVVADWEAAQRAEAAAEKAEAAAERVRGGEALSAVASELGLTVQTSKPVRRDAGDPAANVPQELTAKLFTLEDGGVATAAVNEGHVVAQLTEIEPADAATDSVRVNDLRRTVTEAMTGDIITQFGDALRREVEVTTNPSAIDALF
ncbi:SurA N-terminal domain-containing protein [Rhodospirillaceae bacterium SYSU D60014]|uniref:SurA N-terminal domain-containing protein n=1 Tax=Virgifigura deserti TaxID=2268457 RepID=UPI0013C4698D